MFITSLFSVETCLPAHAGQQLTVLAHHDEQISFHLNYLQIRDGLISISKKCEIYLNKTCRQRVSLPSSMSVLYHLDRTEKSGIIDFCMVNIDLYE